LININDTLYSINDSGGKTYIYRFSDKGLLYDSIFVPNSINYDWEEITNDKEGNIYIGDFGNNTNKRKDLKIYSFNSEKNTTSIPFAYPGQKHFPPLRRREKNYDCEAMIFRDGKLILFSKNKTSKNVSVYSLNPDQQNPDIKQIGTIRIRERITGAGYESDSVAVLLSYGKILRVSLPKEDSPDSFLKILTCKRIPFTRQAEAITYIPTGTLLITNEQGQIFKYSYIYR